MADGILLASDFSERLVRILQAFNIRFVEQLAPIAATFEGQFALANLLGHSVDTQEFRNLLRLVNRTLYRAHSVSLSTPHRVSATTRYVVMAQERHGLGYPIPEFRDVKFGDPLPPSPGSGDGHSGGAVPTTAARHQCVTTPVRNQYFRGTCTAFAAIALLEAKVLRETGRQDLDLSEQYLYFQARQHDPDKKEDGTRPQYVYDALKQHGTCEETLWPYNRYNDW
jgi:C1A family cysteine protease